MAEGLNGQEDEGGGNPSSQSSENNGDFSVNAPTTQKGLCENKTCRDFLRKVCYRGARCKYLHPLEEDLDDTETPPIKRELTFCHDYQNGFCPRSSCRFMHCSLGEENYYVRTGHMLPHLVVQATMKGQVSNSVDGEAPICKDFLTGDCARKRGGKCRFRHLTKTQFEQEAYGRGLLSRHELSDEDVSLAPAIKRPRYDENHHLEFCRERELKRSLDDVGRLDLKSREVSLMEFRDRDREIERERDRRGFEEILMLRKQMETLKKEMASLKKENSDLRATNDFLLEKVTTMNKGAGSVTTVTVPTVSLASTIPVATSVRPLTAAQASHPLSMTSEVASVGSVVAMAAQPQPQPPLPPPTQQVVAQPAVIGSVAGVQVSLSQPPALTAVTLHTSMSQSIAPTLTQTPSNLSQPMSMSGASAHLVSYPIMTQPVLRPQLL